MAAETVSALAETGRGLFCFCFSDGATTDGVATAVTETAVRPAPGEEGPPEGSRPEGDGNGAGFVDASVQRGFDQSAIMSSLGDIQGAICSGFAGVEASANARQIADMQNSFALQSQLASCCCENRLATADLRYTVATENCADRYEAAQNTRDIIENANRNNQAILDKLCALEIDAKNDKIADLERQLTMANLAASQTAQTSRILADNTAQTVALEQYLNPTPIPAYVVQNPNCCPSNTGCGCGF